MDGKSKLTGEGSPHDDKEDPMRVKRGLTGVEKKRQRKVQFAA